MSTKTADIIARLQLNAEQFSSETGAAFAAMKQRAASAAQEVKSEFTSSFAEVQRLAARALDAPRTAKGALDLSSEIAELEKAAQRSDQLSASSRELSVAMSLVAAGGREGAQGIKLEADAAAVAALAHERDAESLRDRVAALKLMQVELDRAAVATARVAKNSVETTGAVRGSGNAFAMAAPQIQDFFIQATAGGNVLQALVIQGGQLAGQLVHVGGAAGAVAKVLMGPWAIGAQVALLVAAPFVAKLFEGAEAADELKKKTSTLEGALAKLVVGTDAARKALKEYNDEKEQAKATDSLAIENSLKAAETRLKEALAIREQIKAQMDKALLDEGSARGLGGGALLAVVASGGAALQRQEEWIKTLNTTLSNLYIDQAAQAEKLVDPIAKINNQYDRQRDAATRAAHGNVELSKALEGTRQQIEKNRQAALKAERDRQSADRVKPTNEIGRTISLDDAKGIVTGIGGRITSDLRTREEQEALYARYKAGKGPLAARPGHSNHELGQALDIAKEEGMTIGKIRDAFKSRGVQITELLDEGAHFHVAWKASAAASKEAGDAAREAAAAQRELEQSLTGIVSRLDPATAAAQSYAKTVAQIGKLQSAGMIARGTAFDLQMRAGKAESDRQGAAFNQSFRDVFGAEITSTITEWERGLTAGAVAASEKLKTGAREAVEEMRYALSSMADLLGVRVDGPMRMLLQSGGIEGQASQVGDAVTQALKDVGVKLDDESTARLSKSIGDVVAGAAYGQVGGSVFSAISGKKSDGAASAIGGILGEVGGKALGKSVASAIGGTLGKTLGSAAGPIGSVVGGILGNVVSGLFTSPKFGTSVITNTTTKPTASAGNSDAAKSGATSLAGAVQQGVAQIADALGGTLSDFKVSIGMFNDMYRVSTTGFTGSLDSKKAAGQGLVNFGKDGQSEAIAFAISDALLDGAVQGISEASKRLLSKATADGLETALSKALLVEAIPRDLKAFLDPVGAAVDELNKKWAKTVAALEEGGASTEQMAQAQQLYNLQLEQVKQSTASASATLKDFLTDLTLGSASPLSLRDQEAAARAQLDPFLAAIEAGQSIDQAKYQSAAQSFLDIERELYGSTSAFFDAFDRIQQATSKAIATIDNATPITPGVPDPFTKATADKMQTGNEIAAQTSDMIAQAVALLQQVAVNTGGSAGGFIGADRVFVKVS